jgi:hypothetical protein
MAYTPRGTAQLAPRSGHECTHLHVGVLLVLDFLEIGFADTHGAQVGDLPRGAAEDEAVRAGDPPESRAHGA